jgi:deoxyribonuclease-4
MGTDAFRFGTVGTPASTPDDMRGTEGTIAHLAAQGLDAFEIGWVRAVRVSEATCQRIREAAEEHDVALSVHAPYYINLNADEQEWPKSRQRLMDAAHYGYLAGATDIVFHPGSYFEQPPEKVLAVAIPRLRECMAQLRQAGDVVTLRPETMGKGAMLGSLQDTLAMGQEIDGVEPCLDFSHLHARPGDGSMNSQAEWEAMLDEYARHLGEEALKRLHCHLSGIEYGPKGERKHLLLSGSDLDLQGLIKALIEFGCGGRIVCESPEKQDDDAHAIRQAWKSAAGTA